MLDEILNGLWNNWMFRLSLSSNELFHSNFLQTVLSDPAPDVIDERIGVTSWARVQELAAWAGLDAGWLAARQEAYRNCEVFIYREWHNLDLAVVVRTPIGEIVLFAVELKIKSYPTLEQVERYLGVMQANNGELPFVPRLVLLSLAQPPAPIGGVANVSLMHFGQLANGIGNLVQFQPNLQPAINEYALLCGLLHQLSQFWNDALLPTTTLHAVTGMNEVYRRLNPVWAKLCAAYLCELVREQMQGFVLGDGIALHIVPGFSRTTWNAEFLWGAVPAIPSAANVRSKVGVQVEGNTIRFMLNADNLQNGIGNARLIVEQTLLAQANSSGLYSRLHERYAVTTDTPAEQVAEIAAFWQQVPGVRIGPNGLPSVGRPQRQGNFQLPGYNNNPTFGHADYRLYLRQDATLEQISDVIITALQGAFNDKGGEAFLDVLSNPDAF
jgi:hypothetical protein